MPGPRRRRLFAMTPSALYKQGLELADPTCIAELDGVKFYNHPWVAGFASRAFYGPVSYEMFYVGPGPTWEDAINEALSDLATRAKAMGANAVLGLELAITPHGPERRLHATGTAASLGALG